MYILLKQSKQKNKKFTAIFYDDNYKKIKTIHFGDNRYEDYTIHKNEERKKEYIKRHRKNENWNNAMSAGALSRWILWNKPSFKDSLKDYLDKFKLKLITKEPKK